MFQFRGHFSTYLTEGEWRAGRGKRCEGWGEGRGRVGGCEMRGRGEGTERKTDGRVTVPNTKVLGVISDKRGSLSLTASFPSPLTPMN